MLTAVLVLQAFILLLIIVLSIVGWRKLTEDRRKLTEQLTEASQKLTQVLSYDRGKLTEDQQKLTEASQKLTEQLTEKRVSVLYEHIIRHETGLFKSKVEGGYQVQFLYDGLPIGEPTEKIVYSEDKVDTEAVQNALAVALQTLQIAIEASGIPLRVLNKVDDAIKTLSKK
ncbi:MAG: hypothetical protein OXL96_17435 [Candidatus Poribacteria bacterium]|nr:hypothetical protein [Candidatus Poribacteria bacterium]